MLQVMSVIIVSILLNMRFDVQNFTIFLLWTGCQCNNVTVLSKLSKIDLISAMPGCSQWTEGRSRPGHSNQLGHLSQTQVGRIVRRQSAGQQQKKFPCICLQVSAHWLSRSEPRHWCVLHILGVKSGAQDARFHCEVKGKNKAVMNLYNMS